eukprot:g1417.t1
MGQPSPASTDSEDDRRDPEEDVRRRRTASDVMEGGVTSTSGGINENMDPHATAAAANNSSGPWKQTRKNSWEAGKGEDVGTGGGLGLGALEGEPLLRDEVADYIGGVDFRDGTGPSALPPNDVARAFRDAEDFALLGRGHEFWSRLMGDDHGRDQHHPEEGGGGGRAGVGAAGKGGGRRGRANGRRRRVVHVESATTGKFFKVYEGVESSGGIGETWGAPGSGGHKSGGDGTRDGAGRGGGGPGGGVGGGSYAEDEIRAAERLGISVREVSLMRLNKGLEAAVLLAQGVLAGLTLASMYTMVLADSLKSFVAAYEAQAAEFRRAMFFLCTLALMGTEDQLLQAKSKAEVWARLGFWGRLDLRVLVWYGCNLARFSLAWTGWLLVCRRRWKASLLSDQAEIELKGQCDKLSAAEEQISRLNGKDLDPLTTKELQELRGSLKRALDNAERMIGLRQ